MSSGFSANRNKIFVAVLTLAILALFLPRPAPGRHGNLEPRRLPQDAAPRQHRTRLADGQVLITGGNWGGVLFFSSAELYSRPLTPGPIPTASAPPDNTIPPPGCSIGGSWWWGVQVPPARPWTAPRFTTRPTTAGLSPIPSAKAAAVTKQILLADGRVLVVGRIR